MIAGIHTISYAALGLPLVIAGHLTETIGPALTVTCYSAAVVLLALLSLTAQHHLKLKAQHYLTTTARHHLKTTARHHLKTTAQHHLKKEDHHMSDAAITTPKQRIFLAGASGVIGQLLIPRLVAAGHVVGAMTRSADKTDLLSHLGAEPILCDVFDRAALIEAVRDFAPTLILNELTDLPDNPADIAAHTHLNARIRTEGNHNLIEAARKNGSPRILAQSVAWQLPTGPGADAVADLERSVLSEGGVILSYGQFYGPHTYYETQIPKAPRVHITHAADRTVALLTTPTGVVQITD